MGSEKGETQVVKGCTSRAARKRKLAIVEMTATGMGSPAVELALGADTVTEQEFIGRRVSMDEMRPLLSETEVYEA